jgi:fermentation-respiration switch protein FrsA (DUF1100 family)
MSQPGTIFPSPVKCTITVVAALAASLVLPAAAAAEFSNVFEGDVACVAQPSNGDVRLCGGPTQTWDGTKIDVNVILPPEPEAGADGPYPLIGDYHGWGGSKIGLNKQTQGWAEGGYAVFSMSDRGWGKSCGGSDPEKLAPVCAHGYNHLMDDRYEVRDAQYLISVLADEGVAQPTKIGATGASFGGGISMALAALRNRVMLPDGTLEAWESPEGKSMEIAAAVPQWPWTDLAYSLMPNGRTLDYVADSPYRGPDGNAPVGVTKSSFAAGLFGLGAALSNYAPPKTDPEADLTTWYALISGGEPYETNPETQDLIDKITTDHSSYYIDHSLPPAPLLIQNGWNDDLFPVDEAIRFYNRTRTQYPDDPISLFLMDDGHMRSQNKQADEELFRSRMNAWFDHYLEGEGEPPQSKVEALTTRCGGASEGPFAAASWRDLAPGEISLKEERTMTIMPGAGDPSIGEQFDPIGGEGACAAAPGADQTGTATYRLPAAPAPGYTLLGSPTVITSLEAGGPEAEVAARLLDVAPEGTETLVSRGLYRVGEGHEQVVFQLHPQAYRFEPSHVAKLELLPADPPYSRPSNTQTPVTVGPLTLRLPVREQPGALEGMVRSPAPKVLPAGYQPALGYTETVPIGGEESSGGGPGTGASAAPSIRPTTSAGAAGLAHGRIRATRKRILLKIDCSGAGPCSGTVAVRRGKRSLAAGPYSLVPGQTGAVRLRLTRAGRRLIGAALHRHTGTSFPVRLEFNDGGRAAFTLTRPLQLGR